MITIAGLTSVELESTMASNHVQYVKHLVNDSSPFVGGLENLLSSYNDLLQAPLQVRAFSLLVSLSFPYSCDFLPTAAARQSGFRDLRNV